MGQMKVRALQECFVGGSRRQIGDEFMVAEGQKLRTKKLPPVMELVDPPKPANGRRTKPAGLVDPPKPETAED